MVGGVLDCENDSGFQNADRGHVTRLAPTSAGGLRFLLNVTSAVVRGVHFRAN
jgi:hypothetical protein